LRRGPPYLDQAGLGIAKEGKFPIVPIAEKRTHHSYNKYVEIRKLQWGNPPSVYRVLPPEILGIASNPSLEMGGHLISHPPKNIAKQLNIKTLKT